MTQSGHSNRPAVSLRLLGQRITAPSGLSPFLSTATATRGRSHFQCDTQCDGPLRRGLCLLEPSMTIAEPLASAEQNLLESEIGRNIPKLPRTGASFRQTESSDVGPAAENLGGLLRQVSKA